MKQLFLVLIFISNLVASEIYATFDVVALQSSDLAFSGSGIVKEVLADSASVVKKGDILAVLDNNELKALVNNAKANYTFAKNELQRQEKVRHLLDDAKFESFKFKYDSAKATLDYQEALLEKTYLKAPFDGIIYEKSVEIGESIAGANPKTVFKLQSSKKRKLVLEFDQKYHDKVNIGDKFRFKLSDGEKEYTSTISKIIPYANSNNRKIKAEVIVDDFLVGLYGEGYIVPAKK
jgi:membrane fusion protein, multidrug efflux system